MSTRSAMWRRGRPWVLRGGAVVLLLAVYAWCWRPARLWLTRHAARPLLTSVETPRAAQFAVRLKGGGHKLHVVPKRATHAAEAAPPTIFEAPAGVRFLLPALFLVAVFPRRLYWAWLWLLHVGAAVLALGALVVGVGWWSGGLALFHVWNRLVLDLFSLVVPLMMWLHGREGRFLPAGEEEERKKGEDERGKGGEDEG